MLLKRNYVRLEEELSELTDRNENLKKQNKYQQKFLEPSSERTTKTVTTCD